MKLYIGLVSPKLLDFLGIFSPLGVGGIGNITLAPFIISRDPMSEGDETHEGIHVMQQYECGVAGSAALLPLLYLLGVPWWGLLIAALVGFLPGVGWFYWIYYATYGYWGFVVKKGLDDFDKVSLGQKAYYLIPFEREAYLYDNTGFEYFGKRKLFAWARIANDERLMAGAELSEKLFLAYQGNHSIGTLFTRTKDTQDGPATPL